MDEISPARRRYQQYLQSPEWRELRRQVWRRCGGKCECCGEKMDVMHLHHLTYQDLFNESLEQLEGLCAICHLRRHGLFTLENLQQMILELGSLRR